MKLKGICIIQVLIAFSIIIMSLSFYLLVQNNINIIQRKTQEELKQSACIKSIYNYISNTELEKFKEFGTAPVCVSSILGEHFNGIKVKIQILKKECFNSLGENIDATYVSVDMIDKGKKIKHMEFIKELT